MYRLHINHSKRSKILIQMLDAYSELDSEFDSNANKKQFDLNGIINWISFYHEVEKLNMKCIYKLQTVVHDRCGLTNRQIFALSTRFAFHQNSRSFMLKTVNDTKYSSLKIKQFY